MRKITILFLFFSLFGFSQQKTTGVISILPQLDVMLTLDNSNSMATMVINGPSDRWFAIGFGNFSNPGAMNVGNDVVYYNGTTLIDARHNGQGVPPSADGVNNWTVTQNTVTSGTRTIIATRPFIAEATDFTFNYSDSTISFAGSHDFTSNFNIASGNHGSNRFNAGARALTLGVNDYTLNATQVYPNPSNGNFLIKTTTNLDKINVYTHAGAFVKTIGVNNFSEQIEVNLNELSSGVYLLELQNATEKSWKKIIIN